MLGRSLMLAQPPTTFHSWSLASYSNPVMFCKGACLCQHMASGVAAYVQRNTSAAGACWLTGALLTELIANESMSGAVITELPVSRTACCALMGMVLFPTRVSL